MMMLTGLLLCAIFTLRVFPDTAAARWLDRTVVARLHSVTRTHLIFLVLMSAILIVGSEVLAIAGPFDVTLVLMWDVSAYIDIVVTTVVVATSARTGGGWRAIMARIAPRRASRARRHRADRKAVPAANDDDRPAFAVAA